MSFVDVGGLDDLSPGAAHGITVGDVSLVAIRIHDSVFVLDGYCTHERMTLADAPVDEFTMYCPRHFSSFDVRTGEVLGPPAEQGLRRYAAKVVEGRVWVDIDGDGGEADRAAAIEGTEERTPGAGIAAPAHPHAHRQDPSSGGAVGAAPPEEDERRDTAIAPDPGREHANVPEFRAPAAHAVPTGPVREPRARGVHGLADGPLARWWSRALFRAVAPSYRFAQRRGLADWLHGTKPLGHPLHPALTDLPFGLWTAAVILYLCGFGDAAAICTVAGTAAAAAAAVTGLADWSVTEARDRRIGALHGGGNVIAVAVQIASISVYYTGGGRWVAFALCAAGLLLSLVSAYLGGHLVFDRAAMVNFTASIDGPRVWTTIGRPQEVSDGDVKTFDLSGRKIIVSRRGPAWSAVESACSHAGARLDQGTFADCTVTCPLHGSVFSLIDGAVMRGPALRPQPCLDVRVEGDELQVRTRT